MTRNAESRNHRAHGWLKWLAAMVFLGCLMVSQAVKADDDGKVYGTISSLPATQGWIGDWTVSGKTIRVTAATRINQSSGPPAVGVYVEVQGNRAGDNVIQATQIETKLGGGGGPQVDLQGAVESLPNTSGFIGNWIVNGKTVRVTTTTYIKQDDRPVAIGVSVEVKGNQQSDGSIAAIQIETRDGGNASSFKGTIEALPSTPNRLGDWKVSGRTVHVTPATKVDQSDGPAAIGASVEIKGAPQADGSMTASEIDILQSPASGGGVNFVRFQGTIEALPGAANFIGSWTVSGRKVNVTAATRIERGGTPPAIGRGVEVSGTLDAGGTVAASKIEVREGPSAGQVEFAGKIETLPATQGWIGDWKVGGRTIHVTATTRIKREYATVAVGAFVEIKGAPQADGSLSASSIEIKQGAGSGGGYLSLQSPPASVSAASYGVNNAAGSIIAAFGSSLATGVAAANALPLPTTLNGTSVLVDGVPAGLFFVSPAQINYALPDRTAPGTASVAVMRNAQTISQGLIDVADVAPSLFTADASGTGAPAGVLLRVKPNGQQIYESLVRFDAAMNKLVPATIRRSGDDRLFLILYGTGFRNAPNSDGNNNNGVAESMQVAIGAANAPVLYAAAAPGFSGLDQINIEIPSFVPPGQNIGVVLKVRDGLGNLAQANTVLIAIE